MKQPALTIRTAQSEDAPAITACVNAAYQHYIERIGKPPGPMLDDYAAILRAHSVYVIDGEIRDNSDKEVIGMLVLMKKPEGLLLDNIAVHPSAQGRGIGRALMDQAEAVAQEWGYDSIHLYTHELMTENIAIYERLGYVEFERREELGFRRVYMRKEIR